MVGFALAGAALPPDRARVALRLGRAHTPARRELAPEGLARRPSVGRGAGRVLDICRAGGRAVHIARAAAALGDTLGAAIRVRCSPRVRQVANGQLHGSIRARLQLTQRHLRAPLLKRKAVAQRHVVEIVGPGVQPRAVGK